MSDEKTTEPADFEALARKHDLTIRVWGNVLPADWPVMKEAVAALREAYALGRSASVRHEPAQPFVVEDPDAPREPTEAQVRAVALASCDMLDADDLRACRNGVCCGFPYKAAEFDPECLSRSRRAIAAIAEVALALPHAALTAAQSRIADLERRLREANKCHRISARR